MKVKELKKKLINGWAFPDGIIEIDDFNIDEFCRWLIKVFKRK